MARHVNNVIDPTHHPQVTLLIHHTGITREVVAFETGQVSIMKSLLVAPQGRQVARRQRQPDQDVAVLTPGQFRAFIIQYAGTYPGSTVG